jgi:hypothetical protein
MIKEIAVNLDPLFKDKAVIDAKFNKLRNDLSDMNIGKLTTVRSKEVFAWANKLALFKMDVQVLVDSALDLSRKAKKAGV